LKANFEEEQDFCSRLFGSKEGRGGHNEVGYFLTVDCFKAFCMMAGTERGKEVRRYYLDIEKRFEALKQGHAQLLSPWEKQLRDVQVFFESLVEPTQNYRDRVDVYNLYTKYRWKTQESGEPYLDFKPFVNALEIIKPDYPIKRSRYSADIVGCRLKPAIWRSQDIEPAR
jgi:hypothetical protein